MLQQEGISWKSMKGLTKYKHCWKSSLWYSCLPILDHSTSASFSRCTMVEAATVVPGLQRFIHPVFQESLPKKKIGPTKEACTVQIWNDWKVLRSSLVQAHPVPVVTFWKWSYTCIMLIAGSLFSYESKQYVKHYLVTLYCCRFPFFFFFLLHMWMVHHTGTLVVLCYENCRLWSIHLSNR